MAITRACIDRFCSNLAQSFITRQPIHSFKVKGSKGPGHSVCKRQRRLTAKSVRICCLFNVDKCAWHHELCNLHGRLPDGTSQNAIFSNKKTQKMLIICQIDWREVGVAFELQCLRNCTLSSYDYFVYLASRRPKCVVISAVSS